jgi:hypothetical protein
MLAIIIKPLQFSFLSVPSVTANCNSLIKRVPPQTSAIFFFMPERHTGGLAT